MSATEFAIGTAVLVASAFVWVPLLAFVTAKWWTVGRLQGKKFFRNHYGD